MQPYLDQIQIVLYQPQDVVNVASIIRVMSNFGLPHLRLVEPAAFDPYRIEGIAHHTRTLVEAVQRYATLDEAVGDCALVLGTTGRPRQADRHIFTPRSAAPLLLGTPDGGEQNRRVAVLFGREQDGLPNEALDRCHGIITIPTHPDNRSLNLAQAALVVAYELWMAASGQPGSTAPPPLGETGTADLASGAEREALFAALEGMLLTLYPTTTQERLAAAVSRLRTLLMRAAPRREEAAALTNLFRHAVRALRQDPEEAKEPSEPQRG